MINSDLYEIMQIAAAIKNNGNKSAYLNELIRQDYENNKTLYEEMKKIIK